MQIGLAELPLLLDATDGDVARIAIEIEKLKLYAGDRKVTAEDIAALAAFLAADESAYITAQIANYTLALQRLTGGS